MRAIGEIVDRMVTKLAAVQWTPSGGATEAAIQQVQRFSSTDLPKAFEYLYTVKQRAAVVVFMGSRFERVRQGSNILLRRLAQIQVLVSDRVLGNIDQATFGVGTVHPGAVVISQLVLDTLSGALFTGGGDTNDTALVPEVENFLTLEDERGKMPGRVAVAIEFTAFGNYDFAALGSSFNG